MNVTPALLGVGVGVDRVHKINKLKPTISINNTVRLVMGVGVDRFGKQYLAWFSVGEWLERFLVSDNLYRDGDFGFIRVDVWDLQCITLLLECCNYFTKHSLF